MLVDEFHEKSAFFPKCQDFGGPSRVDWIRTSDLLHPMQMRYRAAPPPEPIEFTGLQM